MNIESLKTFITLAQVQNFTKTAQQHLVVQSTVSNRIKELENEIGKKLFIRDKKKIKLTPSGELLLNYAKKIVSLEKNFLDEINKSDTYVEQIKIGTVNAIYDCHLHKYINNFLKMYDNISLNIINSKSTNVLNMLHDGSIDIAFSYQPYFGNTYKCIPFKYDDFLLVTTPQNNLYPNGITDMEIRNLPIIYTDFFSLGLSDWFYSLFPENHKFKLEIDVASKAVKTLLLGIGYSFLPHSYIEQELNNGSLVSIELLDTIPMKLQSYIIIKHESNMNTYLKKFLDYVTK